jgi:hypothetical protein
MSSDLSFVPSFVQVTFEEFFLFLFPDHSVGLVSTVLSEGVTPFCYCFTSALM